MVMSVYQSVNEETNTNGLLVGIYETRLVEKSNGQPT